MPLFCWRLLLVFQLLPYSAFSWSHSTSSKVTHPPPVHSCGRGSRPRNQVQMTSFELWVDVRNTKAFIPQGASRCLTRHAPSEPLDVPYLVEEEATSRLQDDHERLVGAVLAITKPEDVTKAINLIGSVDWVVLDAFIDWIQIPCENVIAAAQGGPTRVCVAVEDVEQLSGVAFALETGVDAVLLKPGPDQLWSHARRIQAEKNEKMLPASEGSGAQTVFPSAVGKEQEHVQLVPAKVAEVVPGGVGDRVCLDLVQLLKVGEGCLVGSSAKGLILVQAEVLATTYINPRPFRINAGPVHSYVLMEDGSAKYLSEIQAGDRVRVVSADGHSRGVTVGRCKIESRPLLKVSFQWPAGGEGRNEGGTRTAQIFLQQAETVCLVRGTAEGGGCTSVTRLQAGDMVVVRARSQGTHLGNAIKAHVEEK